MKKFYLLLIGLISFLLGINTVSAITFDPVFSMDPEIEDNSVFLTVGVNGLDMQAVSTTMSYDNTKLELVNIEGINDYTYTMGKEIDDGKFTTINIIADSYRDHKNVDYMVMEFKLKSTFKVDKTADVFFYNYEVASNDMKKYRNAGRQLTFTRPEQDTMAFNLEDLTSTTKITYWLGEHVLLIVFIIILIIAGIVTLLLLPSKRKKEHRDNNMRDQLRNGASLSGNKFVGYIPKETFEEEVVETPFKNSESKFIVEEKVVEDPLANLRTDDDFKEIEEEDLALFNPTMNEEEKDDNSSINIPIIFLLILASIAFIAPVNASISEMNAVRKAVVSGSYVKDQDLNNDKKLDVVDLVIARRKYMATEDASYYTSSEEVTDEVISVDNE